MILDSITGPTYGSPIVPQPVNKAEPKQDWFQGLGKLVGSGLSVADQAAGVYAKFKNADAEQIDKLNPPPQKQQPGFMPSFASNLPASTYAVWIVAAIAAVVGITWAFKAIK